MTRYDLTPVAHWSDITEDDIPRLAILTDSFARFIGHGNDASVVTVWREGTPIVVQVDGEPNEEAVDLVTDVICGNIARIDRAERESVAPVAANDNRPQSDEVRLREMFGSGTMGFDGDTRRHFLSNCWHEGKLGVAIIGDDGEPYFEPYQTQPRPPIHATPFVLRDPSSLPERDWLYGKHYIRKYLTSTVGAGGGGKSAHAVSETLAMVTGRPLLDPDGPLIAPLRVWYINAEDPQDEIDRRFHAAAKHFDVTAEQIGDRLFTDSGREQEFVIMRQDGRGFKVCQPLIDEMVTEIQRRQIDVVIIDPLVSTHEVPENDNGAMQRVAKAWTEVADRANCCVEVIHHVVKSQSEVTADSARGGGALKDKTRGMRVLNAMTAGEAEKVGLEKPDGYFRIDHGKVNMVASGRSQWRRFVSVSLGNGKGLVKTGDEIGVVEHWRWPSADILAERAAEQRRAVVADVPDDLLAGLKVRLGAGGYKYDPKGKPWAGDVLIETGIAADKDEARAMLVAWIESGELEISDEVDPVTRHERKFVRPAATM
ncbi:MAG: helicase RepA family protein [Aquamicrobium sp.]|uniref:AAA family ATPase n=1 Tax=Aquamicrobium sp. TaxID=1872579 RepID=UPI00349EAE27|nr:helicase RepA family protein [Aquamicrobium sp.]